MVIDYLHEKDEDMDMTLAGPEKKDNSENY